MPNDLAAQLDQYLRSKGSPLTGLGRTFVSAGQRAGVDPRLLVAISGGETSFGKTGNATGLHNAWGWMGGPGGTLSSFPNWDAGISTIAQGLGKNYVGQGLKTLPEIGAKWAPVGAANDPRNLNSNWVKTNSQFYRELGGQDVGGGVGGVPLSAGVPSSQAPALPTATPASTLPAAPSYAPPNISGALLGSLGKDPGAQLNAIMGALLSPQALPTSPQAETSGMPTSPAAPESGPVPRTSLPPGEVGKWASLAPSADRGGARTNQSVLSAVARIARVHGSPLTISTGTNHNQYVVDTNRESQHWKGNAADIAYGHGTGSDNIDPALTRLGRAALVAAGMPRAEAAKQTGGVFNVGGWNILFNTYTGGNHYNHLHVGV